MAQPLVALYRDDLHVGFAPNSGHTLLMVTELDNRVFVEAMNQASIDRPVGMARAAIFRRSREWDTDYDMPRYDFDGVR